MCYQKDLFNSIKHLLDKCYNVIVPDERKVRVKHFVNIQLANDICLKEVLYVPKFHFNLIYVHKLIRQLNCSITFYPNTCFIQEQLKKHLLLDNKNKRAHLNGRS